MEKLRVSHSGGEQSGVQKRGAVCDFLECAKRAYNFVSSPRGPFPFLNRFFLSTSYFLPYARGKGRGSLSPSGPLLPILPLASHAVVVKQISHHAYPTLEIFP